MEQPSESLQAHWYRARTKDALGRALQAMRQDTGATQDELAAVVNSSRPHLSRMERGATPQLDTLMAVINTTGYELVLVPRGSTITVEPPR